MIRPKRVWTLLVVVVLVAFIPTLMLHRPPLFTYSVMSIVLALALWIYRI